MQGIAFESDGGAMMSAFGWPLLLLGAPWILLFLAWYVTGSLMVLRGNSVDKPNRVPLFYGYTVCLIALVLGLMSIASLLDSVFERANPLQSASGYGLSLSSFEAYLANRATTPVFGRESGATPDTASIPTLRARYDALVQDRLSSVRYQSTRTMVSQGLFLLIAIGLFAFHWRWTRRLNGPSTAG